MKKTGIIVAPILILLIIGGGIIAWSVYQKGEKEPLRRHVIDITDDNFHKEVVQASLSRPILVDFYAEWCFPCKMLEPTLEALSKEFEGRAVIGRVDTDKHMVARKFGINKLPTVMVIRDKEIKKTWHGVVPKATIAEALEEFGA